MSKIIALANQKGGVGKSTTAINLAASLAELGQKILVIDLDPQGNTTSGFGVERDSVDKTVYDLLIDNHTYVNSCLIRTEFDGLRLIPSNEDLSGAEIELLSLDDKEYLLKKKIDPVRSQYDYILIDCPPSLSVLTLNALTTADSVLIPVQSEYYALEGLTQLLKTIQLVKERLNDRLKIEGIVFTMFDGRTNLAMEVVTNVKENLDARVFNTIIPRNVKLAEAPSYGLPINRYAKNSTGAQSYHFLAMELMNPDSSNPENTQQPVADDTQSEDEEN